MTEQFVMRVRTHSTETQAVLDRLGYWLDVDRPDGFLDVKELSNHVDTDHAGHPWACVTFEAADIEMAEFTASLAKRECGLSGMAMEIVRA